MAAMDALPGDSLLARMTAPEAVARRRGGRQPRTSYAGNSWLGSVLVWEGRTADRFMYPWVFVMAVTTAWTVPVLLYRSDTAGALLDLGAYSTAHTAVQVVLSFLLVFRLNRSAERYWATRALWGKHVEVVRQLAGLATAHLSGPDADALLAWACAFAVTSKCLLRGGGEKLVLDDELAGILSPEECAAAASALSPSLFCAGGMCATLAAACSARGDIMSMQQTTAVFAVLQLRIDELVGTTGGMERIKGTPLPIAYVSHLRTFLLGYLLVMPLLYVHSWRWGTLPAMALVSFALLGVEGAAAECESPFEARLNHLPMEIFVQTVFRNVEGALAAAPVHRRLAELRLCGAAAANV